MSEVERRATKPTNDYITDLTASSEIEPPKAALVVVDMQYATGSRKAGLGKRLTEEGKLDALARERFDRIENVVVPNLRKVLAFFRENGLRVIYLTIGSEMEDYNDAPPHMVRLFKTTNNRKGQLEHEIVEEVKRSRANQCLIRLPSAPLPRLVSIPFCVPWT